MAGAFTQTNAAQLAAALGRQPSEGELYIAHFLGSDGRLEADRRGDEPAERQRRRNCFRKRRRRTPAYSSNKSGQPRSVSEVYADADRPLRGCARHRVCVRRCAAAYKPRLPDPAGVAQAYAQANCSPLADSGAGPGGAAGGAAVLPEHVHRSRQPRGDADREQSVDAGRGGCAGRQQPPLMLNLFSDPPAGGAQACRRQDLTRRAQLTTSLTRHNFYGERFVKRRRLGCSRAVDVGDGCQSRQVVANDCPSVSAVDPPRSARRTGRGHFRAGPRLSLFRSVARRYRRRRRRDDHAAGRSLAAGAARARRRVRHLAKGAAGGGARARQRSAGNRDVDPRACRRCCRKPI